MHPLTKLTIVETKLFLREPAALIGTLALPTIILLVLGAIPGLRQPAETFGGVRFIDVFAPSLVVMTLATLAVNLLPNRLATYREKGILRRLSTTPLHPANLLVAQLVLNAGVAIVSVALLMVVGRLVFAIPFPAHVVGFAAAFLCGGTALFALGLMAAALARTARTANAIALPMFFGAMLLGGVWLPRFLLPDLLVTIGAYMPPGVQALQDAWTGGGPDLLHLVIMAAVAVGAATVAAKTFRWE